MPGNLSILCNMVVINIFFSISKPNNPKIVRKYRAAWNFLQIYFVTLSDYHKIIIMKFYTSASLALKCLLYKDAFIIHQNKQIGDRHAKILTVLCSPRFSCLFCLLFSRILQNICLTCISLKFVDKYSPSRPAILLSF